jgi:hypothetical protein
VVALPIAVIVFEPDVRVVPSTVMLYPVPAFVEAAIWDIATAVSVGENSWLKSTAPGVAVEQSGTPLVVVTVCPVQKMMDSGMIPVSTICVEVLAVTVPLSKGEPVAFVEAYICILTKKDVLVAAGFLTFSSCMDMSVSAAIAAAVRVMYGAAFVVLFRVKPDTFTWVPIVAEVVTTSAGVHVPAAVVQYSNLIEPVLPPVGVVNVNRWFT